MASSREKIEESFALLNSLWAATQDASNSASVTAAGGPTSMATLPAGGSNRRIEPTLSSSPSPSTKSIFPPTQRAPVLDKLAKLTTKRPSLKDSIAASITASASISKRVPGQSQPFGLPVSPASLSSPSTKSNRYMPWSREQFHDRLSTFKPSTWFDKPQLVNPVECAMYGWINKGDDRLECFGGCGGVAIMKAGIESTSSPSAPTAKDTERIPALLDGSQEGGPVVLDEDDVDDVDLDTEDNIYKFPVLSRTQAKDEYLERLKGLEKMKDDPLVTKIHHPLTDEELEALRTVFPSQPENTMVLALFGWQRVQSDAHGDSVGHVIGYSSLAGIDGDLDLEEEESQDGFHAVGSHKWYCYWIDPKKSQEPDREGWRVLLSTLTGLTRHGPGDSAQDLSGHPVKKQRLEPREALARVKRIIRSGRT
ncbi:hypothetical protein BGZ73_004517 [Actinomortierella ambigua]|nr:hypothetical protein BGZ73_004517 [Actinomortierella ambigua]